MPPSRTCMHQAHAGTSRERSRLVQLPKRSWPCCRFAFRWAFKLAPRVCRSWPKNWNAIQRARNQVDDLLARLWTDGQRAPKDVSACRMQITRRRRAPLSLIKVQDGPADDLCRPKVIRPAEIGRQ